jgi:hypothetical protein
MLAGAPFGVASCEAGAPTERLPSGEIDGVVTLETRRDLPECNPSRKGSVYYIQADNKFVYCDGSVYRTVSVVGEPGADGQTWIVETTDATSCANGGVVIRTGPDENQNGVLEGDEVRSEAAVCNGADGEPGPAGDDGAASLIETRVATADECEHGGTVLLIGTDNDGDGALDSQEIAVERPVCDGADGTDGSDGADGADGTDGSDGADGADGTDGKNSLISTSPASTTDCVSGGTAVRVGVDDDGDGHLDTGEVDAIEIICNGVPQPDGGAPEQCAPLHADCNSEATDGCETNIGTDTAHCGVCANVCPTLPNTTAPTCAGGECRTGTCVAGFGNCDSADANGCEVEFEVAPNTCQTADDAGADFGDTECLVGLSCEDASNPSMFFTSTGRTSRWLSARVLEHEHTCSSAYQHQLELITASNVDFDLYVYSSCGVLLESSTNGSGATETVTVRLPEVETRYWVEVRYVSGSSCGTWWLGFRGSRC